MFDQLFSALVGILPSSKSYLNRAGFSAPSAEWIRLGCFIAGFVGIQVVSRFLHRFIPSHVVDCDHTHAGTPSEGRSNHHSRTHSHGTHDQSRRHSRSLKLRADGSSKMTESTPLLNGENGRTKGKCLPKSVRQASFRGDVPLDHRLHTTTTSRRPSMMEVQSRVMSFVKDTKDNCDQNGPCYGYSDPCGRECFKRIGPISLLGSRKPTIIRTLTGTRMIPGVLEIPKENNEVNELDLTGVVISSRASTAHSRDPGDQACESDEEGDLEAQHHHHVPTNAFLSIGLQTSIAIALHKLPEGFITYATNHANPSLGFTVFMALFIHNITEGFAMALPLYLALGSRLKAMLWSSVLGGFSQPIGAGIAAIWFKVAKHTSRTPGFAVYGCMFAVTAGIMASVALSLFVESLSINHNSQLCVASALVGMAILGISTALTA
jgi:zinc transporter, ZIP family